MITKCDHPYMSHITDGKNVVCGECRALILDMTTSKATLPKPAPEDVMSKTELTCKKESLHCGPCCACTRIKTADLATPEADQLKRAVELLRVALPELEAFARVARSYGLSPEKLLDKIKEIETFLKKQEAE